MHNTNTTHHHPDMARKRIGARLALTGAISILLCSCGAGGGGGGGNVALVKKGVLEVNQRTTVGEALDSYGYFRTCEWQSGKTPNGMEFVNAMGELDMDKLGVWGKEGNTSDVEHLVATFQFAINRDGKTFEYSAFDVRAVMKDGTAMVIADLLNAVFDNDHKPDAQKRSMGISSPQVFRLFQATPKGTEALARVYANEPLLKF